MDNFLVVILLNHGGRNMAITQPVGENMKVLFPTYSLGKRTFITQFSSFYVLHKSFLKHYLT